MDIDNFDLTPVQREMVEKAMEEFPPHITPDPVVNWVVDCLTLDEDIKYDAELYEAEVEAFASLD